MPARAALRILAAALCLCAPAAATAQVSPGPLARPHHGLEGNLTCFKCHGKGKEGMTGRCLECHQEIAWLRDHQRGLHGRLPAGAACATCHPDHGGLDFSLIQWDEGDAARFDHARAGWPLDGAHAAIDCAKCHQTRLRVSPAVALSPRGETGRRWTGLETTCGSCHQDIHRGSLGADCARCHGTARWRPVAGFDHSRTRFALTGRHAQVDCMKCHMAPGLALASGPDGKPMPLYKPLPFAECGSCHQDPHAGRFGPACSRCHETEGWKRIGEKRFDHDLTRYPLRGRHAALACASCHDPVKAWGRKPAFSACSSCHRDAHAGTATVAGRAVDCASCHDVAGWRPSTFTVSRHARSLYPLEGAHERVSCAGCHTKNPRGAAEASLGSAGILMRPPRERCRSCHEDAHRGQVASRAHGGACESCHAVSGWTPSTFTARDHASLRLPLEGRHAAIACAACHGPARKGLPPLPGPDRLGSAKVALTLPGSDCVDCHRDPHDGRFSPRGARAKKQGCLACHDMRGFRPSTVDVTAHAAFGSPLAGAHRAVACDRCHVECRPGPARSSLALARDGATPLSFFVNDQRCAACHEDPHAGQFAHRKDRGACGACHGEETFRPAIRFDHDRDAGFRLAGAHARVACARCHASSRRGPDARLVVLYRPLPSDCRSCHSNKATSSSGPPAPGRTDVRAARAASAPHIAEEGR